MNPFRFSVPTEIIFESGSSLKAGDILRERGVDSALIITDKGVLAAGCLDNVFESLKGNGITFGVYDGVEQNPAEETVEEALRMLIARDYDSVIAVGGGSSLDTGKATIALLKEKREIGDLYSQVLRGDSPLPLMAIPTTAGTGSEVTWSAVITDTRRRVKETIRGEYMYPDYAIVDPELTLSLPKTITASTGMDALTHAIEAFITTRAHAMSDALAMEACLLIFNNLRDAVMEGDNIEARSAMSIASTLSGMAFSISGLGMVHGLAEPLGGRLNIPHGIANSVLLPYCLKFNQEAAKEKLATLSNLIGDNGSKMSIEEEAASLVSEVKRLSRDVGIPEKLEDVEVSKEEFDALVDDASVNSCLPGNPRSVSVEEIEAIYSEVLDL